MAVAPLTLCRLVNSSDVVVLQSLRYRGSLWNDLEDAAAGVKQTQHPVWSQGQGRGVRAMCCQAVAAAELPGSSFLNRLWVIKA